MSLCKLNTRYQKAMKCGLKLFATLTCPPQRTWMHLCFIQQIGGGEARTSNHAANQDVRLSHSNVHSSNKSNKGSEALATWLLPNDFCFGLRKCQGTQNKETSTKTNPSYKARSRGTDVHLRAHWHLQEEDGLELVASLHLS